MHFRQQEDQLDNNLTQYDLSRFSGSHEAAASYYFKEIQKLDIELLVHQIEVSDQEKQLNTLQQKIETFKQINKISDIETGKSPESSLPKEIECKSRDCHKKFQKESTKKNHEMLEHQKTSALWLGNPTFSITIQAEEQTPK